MRQGRKEKPEGVVFIFLNSHNFLFGLKASLFYSQSLLFSSDIYVQIRSLASSDSAVIRTKLVDEGQQVFSLIINHRPVSLCKAK